MNDGKTKQIRVLFVCNHNVSRSFMAETFLNALGKGRFHAESAGLDPWAPNPLVIRAMREEGYALEGRRGNSIFEYLAQGRRYDYMVCLCAPEDAAGCPVFPGVRESLSWPFPDPSQLRGSDEEKLSEIRRIRDRIKAMIEEWMSELEKRPAPGRR